ncbi:GAF and ANTAR domain-containing protein [Winogradskya humida]|uniref:GAF and ANTAR domain-containing protein n=1 Tax=Winogradskya humida TaxID=113566 RepID=UPI001944D1BF|nr:GAF and ANTAR domain-containing protein [Actinoplanes humidus]
MTTLSTGQLSKIFVEAADTLTAEFNLRDFLHMLTKRTADLVGAAAVGMLLADEHDELQFMAASQDNAMWLELFQLQSQEGPCLEAFRSGHPVVNADLPAAGGRWPLFAPRAVAAGFQSVHAFPLRVRREVIGALNVFGTVVGADFDDADVPIVQALADVAAIGLLQQRALLREQTLTDQLQHALESRVIIEQAKGVIIRAYDVSPDEAFTLLRTYSRRNSRRIADLALAIVTDPANIPDLTRP